MAGSRLPGMWWSSRTRRSCSRGGAIPSSSFRRSGAKQGPAKIREARRGEGRRLERRGERVGGGAYRNSKKTAADNGNAASSSTGGLAAWRLNRAGEIRGGVLGYK